MAGRFMNSISGIIYSDDRIWIAQPFISSNSLFTISCRRYDVISWRFIFFIHGISLRKLENKYMWCHNVTLKKRWSFLECYVVNGLFRFSIDVAFPLQRFNNVLRHLRTYIVRCTSSYFFRAWVIKSLSPL